MILMMCGILFRLAFKNVPENEKWVITRLGKTSVRDQGRFIQIPLLDQVSKVDIRESSTKIQDQACITKDMQPVIIHMMVDHRVIDPVRYSTLTKPHKEDFVLLSSSTLKEVVSTHTLDEILSARNKLGADVCDKLNREIDPRLGVKVEKVKLLDIVITKKRLAAMAATGDFPTQCPSCGAPLQGQEVKGTRQVKCQYCGYIIKL